MTMRIFYTALIIAAHFYLFAFAPNEPQESQSAKANKENDKNLTKKSIIISATCDEKREFHCKLEDRCIPLEWRCDFTEQCLDGQDELNCAPEWCDFDHNLCHWLNDLKLKWTSPSGQDKVAGDNYARPTGALGIWRRYFAMERYNRNDNGLLFAKPLEQLNEDNLNTSKDPLDRVGKFIYVPLLLDNHKKLLRRSASISSPLIGQTNSGCQLRFKYSLFANQTPQTDNNNNNNNHQMILRTKLTLRTISKDGQVMRPLWSRWLDSKAGEQENEKNSPNWMIGVAELGHLSQVELSFEAESQVIAVSNWELAAESKMKTNTHLNETTHNNLYTQLVNNQDDHITTSHINKKAKNNGDKLEGPTRRPTKREQRQHGLAIIAIRWLRFHHCRWPLGSVEATLDGSLSLPGRRGSDGRRPRAPVESQVDNNYNNEQQQQPRRPEDENKPDNNNNNNNNNPLELESFSGGHSSDSDQQGSDEDNDDDDVDVDVDVAGNEDDNNDDDDLDDEAEEYNWPLIDRDEPGDDDSEKESRMRSECQEDQFECSSNGICLARSKLCNLVNNCMSLDDEIGEDEGANLCQSVPGMETFDDEEMRWLNNLDGGGHFWTLNSGNWPRDLIKVVDNLNSAPHLPSRDHSSTLSSTNRLGRFLSLSLGPTEQFNYSKGPANVREQNKQALLWASIESPPMQKLPRDECRLKFFYNIVTSSYVEELPFKVSLAIEHFTLGNINELGNRNQSGLVAATLDAFVHSHQIDVDSLILHGKRSMIEYPGVDFWREFNERLVGLNDGDIFSIRLTIFVESNDEKKQKQPEQQQTSSRSSINFDDLSLHFGCSLMDKQTLTHFRETNRHELQMMTEKSHDLRRLFRPKDTKPLEHHQQHQPAPTSRPRRNKWMYNFRPGGFDTTATGGIDSPRGQVEPQKLIVYVFGVVCTIIGLIAIIVFVLVPYVERVMMSYQEQIQLGLGAEISDVPIQGGGGGGDGFGSPGRPSSGASQIGSYSELTRPADLARSYSSHQQLQQQQQWRLIGSQTDSSCYHHQVGHNQELPQAPSGCGSGSSSSGDTISGAGNSTSGAAATAATFVDSSELAYHHKLEFIRSRMATNSSNSLANLLKSNSISGDNCSSIESLDAKTTSQL